MLTQHRFKHNQIEELKNGRGVGFGDCYRCNGVKVD